jgi:hypothetical protein
MLAEITVYINGWMWHRQEFPTTDWSEVFEYISFTFSESGIQLPIRLEDITIYKSYCEEFNSDLYDISVNYIWVEKTTPHFAI